MKTNARLKKETDAKKGFSLIEVIVSIAALALASSIILQLFLIASYRNDRGKRMDMAVLFAQSVLESFKGESAPTDLFDTFLSGLWEERQGGYYAEADFSDEAFSRMASGDALFRVEAVLMPKQTGHETSLGLNFDGSGEAVVSAIYRLTLRVSSYRADGSEDALLTIGADNLFTYLEAPNE